MSVPPAPAPTAPKPKPAKPINPLVKKILRGLLDDYEPAVKQAAATAIDDIRKAIPGLKDKAIVAINKLLDETVVKVDALVVANGTKLVDGVLAQVHAALK